MQSKFTSITKQANLAETNLIILQALLVSTSATRHTGSLQTRAPPIHTSYIRYITCMHCILKKTSIKISKLT